MKPIIFSTPMVRAVLEGRKTQTRRVIKPQPTHEVVDIWTDTQDPPRYHFQSPWAGKPCDGIHVGGTVVKPRIICGDVLYVRETWRESYHHPATEYEYRADGDNIADNLTPFEWRPSIHMPRAAARIFLRVTDVRTERVQEISQMDCVAEGIEYPKTMFGNEWVPDYLRRTYKELWNALNAKRGYGWDNNPWVWIYTLERVNEDGTPCAP